MPLTSGANQYLRIFLESAYGVDNTAKVSPIEETDFSWQRLHTNNAFTMRPAPQFVEIRSADGQNRGVQLMGSRYTLTGSLTTPFYPTKAQFILNAILNLSGSPLNLPSFDIDHFDGIRDRRYLGCMVRRATIRGDAQSQYYTLTIDWVAQQYLAADPTVSAPASTSFPTSAQPPYRHTDTAGVVLVNNLSRVNYSSVEITVENKLAMCWGEQAYITGLFWSGRDISYTIKSAYQTVTDRNNMESITKLLTNQIKWVQGAHNVVLDLKSTNYEVAVNDDLPLDDPSYQTLTIRSLYDQTASTDLSFTAA